MADHLSQTQPRVVRVAEIPTEENIDFHDTSFFTQNAPGAKLPSPEEVRKLNFELNGRYAKNQRPPLVFYEDLGLVVKYGRWIHVAEAQCLWWFNRHMKDVVPTPELFGWRHDGDEVFIYMELIKGEILEDAWPDLSEGEKDGICQDLRACVKAWRGLRQETEPYFIGELFETLIPQRYNLTFLIKVILDIKEWRIRYFVGRATSTPAPSLRSQLFTASSHATHAARRQKISTQGKNFPNLQD